MTCEQNNLSRDALKRADTSNAYTRESLEFTKKATLSSDSSTKEALRISDSSLNVAVEGLRISELNMMASNTAYISIKAAIIQFGEEEISYGIIFKNGGHTPAFKINGFTAAEITEKNKSFWITHITDTVGAGMLAPNDTLFTIQWITKPTTCTFEKVYSGWFTFKIYGFMEYTDIFNHRYRMDYLRIYDPILDAFSASNEGNTYKRIY